MYVGVDMMLTLIDHNAVVVVGGGGGGGGGGSVGVCWYVVHKDALQEYPRSCLCGGCCIHSIPIDRCLLGTG